MDLFLISAILIVGLIVMALLIKLLLQKEMNAQHLTLNSRFQEFEDRLEMRMNLLEDLNRTFERVTHAQLMDSFERVSTAIHKDLSNYSTVMETKFSALDTKVDQRLNQGFEKTNETFANIVERLGKIDEAQKKIDALSTDIVSLQDVLTDKKARGTFGEVQLHQILASVFGDRNDAVYEMQKTLSSGVRVDALIHAPQPLGNIAVDSKFPLENYRRLMDEAPNTETALRIRRDFVQDCKRHIDAIANKYIIVNETSDQAFMFVPAEAVFAYINAYLPDVLSYAQKKRVWLVSPTTFMSTLTLLHTVLINVERDKYAAIIQRELNALTVEFGRYKSRWDTLSSHLDLVSKDVKDIHITTDKITRRFESIANVESVKEVE